MTTSMTSSQTGSSMRIYRLGWTVVALLVGSLGAYVTSAQQSGLALVVGVGIGLIAAVGIGIRYPGWSWTAVPVEITRTVIAAAASWATLGLLVLIGPFGALVALVLTLSAPGVLTWIGHTVRHTLGRLDRTPTPAVASHHDIGRLSLADLCQRWCSSSAELHRLQLTHQFAALAVLVSTRESYLDELERRDPAGFGRWLASDTGSAGDPGGYLAAPTSL